ncbi:hypothetical protein NDU88_000140 [Pleurodeles waltl]|uniref:Uncharacterized protein n=1 Tax=Pleurodeles waltl TaxID=8319 RepID=A0AAV7V864_PLEWA|nr:hypothetical protein NDU88_000140 [Pleurodeles waltl]
MKGSKRRQKPSLFVKNLPPVVGFVFTKDHVLNIDIDLPLKLTDRVNRKDKTNSADTRQGEYRLDTWFHLRRDPGDTLTV